MARAPELEREKLSSEQKRVHDEIAKRIPHGIVRGPFAVLLNAPALAEGALLAYSAIRAARLERRLVELMILIVARFHSAQYEWFAHGPRALEAGIAAETVEAIRQRRTPALAREDERMVYDVVSELLATRRLSAASFERAHALLGTERLVELIAGAGFYTMLALTINGFDVDVPEGARPLPE
jgi:4-carboxymuconolactone decarboxylase